MFIFLTYSIFKVLLSYNWNEKISLLQLQQNKGIEEDPSKMKFALLNQYIFDEPVGFVNKTTKCQREKLMKTSDPV